MALMAGAALSGCADGPSLFGPELPAGVIEQTSREYPNVNLPPDRPSFLRNRADVRDLESELEGLRERHVEDQERELEGRS